METCKVTYVWTKEEARRASFARSRRRGSLGLLFFTRCCAFLLGAAMISLIIAGSPFSFPAWVFLLFCAFWTILSDKVILFLALRKFEKYPFANQTIQQEFSQQQIDIQWGDVGSFQFSWKLIRRIIVARDGLIMTQQKTSLWLPYDAFETPQCIEKVKEFARSNDVKIIEAKR